MLSCKAMREEFLHYIWLHHVRLQVRYATTQGDTFTVLDKGVLNTDAGADILQARVKINDIEWVGSVEFHIRASDWEKHGHHKDAAYDNVLLHFVAEADENVYTKSGRLLPVFIFPKLAAYYRIYQEVFATKQFIYCENEIRTVPPFVKKMWLERLVIERLEEKTEAVFKLLTHNKNSWEETAYQIVVRYLGQRLNGDAFEQLARKLPQSILVKHKNSVFQLEALLFGQAGMLKEAKKSVYYNKLQQEYTFLQKKYSLEPMDGVEWKFLRLRPANFPTLRIAQLSMLLHSSGGLFSQFLEKETLKDYRKLFSFSTTPYWDMHYLFERKTERISKRKIGKSLQDTLIINGIVPLLFAYSRYVGESRWQGKALRLLQELSAERNHIVTKFQTLDFLLRNAYNSQAIIQLKTKYCDKKYCENCAIGNDILKRKYN